MFENSGLTANQQNVRQITIIRVIFMPCIIAAIVIMLGAFPFHYLPRSVFWPAAFAAVLLCNLLNRRIARLRKG